MALRSFIVTTFALAALASCASGGGEERAAFDPASCTARDFNVYFEDLTTELSPEARQMIDEMGETIHGCRINHVRIVGSADAVGGENASDERSQQRAMVIADYLTRHVGWPRSRMELLATGERGAVTEEGLNVPMRRRARVTVEAVAP